MGDKRGRLAEKAHISPGGPCDMQDGQAIDAEGTPKIHQEAKDDSKNAGSDSTRATPKKMPRIKYKENNDSIKLITNSKKRRPARLAARPPVGVLARHVARTGQKLDQLLPADN